VRLEIKQIKNIKQLKKCSGRWSINFTDGSNLTVRNPLFPFRINDSQGMMVQFFQSGESKKALFGWPKKEGSIVLRDCYEWSEECDFDQVHTDWNDYFRFDPVKEAIDKRRSGKPIILNINSEGDIMPP